MRPLHNIDLLQKGDVIVVETKASYIVYTVDRHVIVTPDKVEVIAPVPPRPGAKPTQAWDDDDSVPSQAQRSVPLQGWAVANRHDSSYTPVGIRHGSHPAGASTGGDDDAARRVWGEVRERQVTVRWVYMPAE